MKRIPITKDYNNQEILGYCMLNDDIAEFMADYYSKGLTFRLDGGILKQNDESKLVCLSINMIPIDPGLVDGYPLPND